MRNKNLDNIGLMTGPLLVFGGVYSNLQSLLALQKKSLELGIPPSNIICTGDVVGYCAQPEEAVTAIREWGIHCIAGNVELQLSDGEEDCGCNFEDGSRCAGFSKLWYPYAQTQLSPDSLAWMEALPLHVTFQYGGKQVYVLHGSVTEPAGYVFRSTTWEEKQEQFNATQADIILAGHCGLPFHQTVNTKQWLNPGVIGMPANDGTPRVWYMTLNDANNPVNFEHHSYDYDHETAARLMREKQLPDEYASTLSTGLWDNCEILPGEETALQGVEIEF